jgi:spore germination protein YaaH
MASTTPTIPAKKIVMGIPTYGRVWRIESNGTYTQVGSVNYNDAIALAAARNVPVKRGKSGELSFDYTGTTSGLPSSTTATPSRLQNRYFVSFSDAVSIQAHVDLAKKLGLGGVALFKLDGNTDPAYANTFFK